MCPCVFATTYAENPWLGFLYIAHFKKGKSKQYAFVTFLIQEESTGRRCAISPDKMLFLVIDE